MVVYLHGHHMLLKVVGGLVAIETPLPISDFCLLAFRGRRGSISSPVRAHRRLFLQVTSHLNRPECNDFHTGSSFSPDMMEYAIDCDGCPPAARRGRDGGRKGNAAGRGGHELASELASGNLWASLARRAGRGRSRPAEQPSERAVEER